MLIAIVSIHCLAIYLMPSWQVLWALFKYPFTGPEPVLMMNDPWPSIFLVVGLIASCLLDLRARRPWGTLLVAILLVAAFERIEFYSSGNLRDSPPREIVKAAQFYIRLFPLFIKLRIAIGLIGELWLSRHRIAELYISLWQNAGPISEYKDQTETWFSRGLLFVAFGCAFAALVIYLGSKGIFQFCIRECDASIGQSHNYVLVLLALAGLTFDIATRKIYSTVLLGLALVLYVLVKVFSIWRSIGIYVFIVAQLYIIFLPLLLAIACCINAVLLMLRRPIETLIAATLALSLTLVAPHLFVRWSIDQNTKKIADKNYCLHQRVGQRTVLTQNVWELHFGKIISINAARIHLISPNGIDEWRFRKMKFETLKGRDGSYRLEGYGKPKSADIEACAQLLGNPAGWPTNNPLQQQLSQ